VPFRFTGKLDKLTFKLGPEQLMQEDQKAKAEAHARVHSQMKDKPMLAAGLPF
jgi:hypothetical protein